MDKMDKIVVKVVISLVLGFLLSFLIAPVESMRSAMCPSMSHRTQTNADRKKFALIEPILLDKIRNKITKRPSVVREQLQIVRFLLAEDSASKERQ